MGGLARGLLQFGKTAPGVLDPVPPSHVFVVVCAQRRRPTVKKIK
jgi:hypothetical protein